MLLCADREVTFLAARKIGTDRKTQNGLQDGWLMAAGFQNTLQRLTYGDRLCLNLCAVVPHLPPHSLDVTCMMNFPGLPYFCHSFTSVYYCQCNPRNEKKNEVGLGTRLIVLSYVTLFGCSKLCQHNLPKTRWKSPLTTWFC